MCFTEAGQPVDVAIRNCKSAFPAALKKPDQIMSTLTLNVVNAIMLARRSRR